MNHTRTGIRFLAPLFGIVALAALLLTVPTLAGAQTWSEAGDAGDMIDTASITVGTGSLTTLSGTLATGSDEVDMYCISIPDLPNFSASMTCIVIAARELWLFDANGFGVQLDDSCNGGLVMIAGGVSTGPGQYYLAISENNDEALSSSGTIWAPASSPGSRAPDGPGAANPLTGWSHFVPLGPASPPYTINLTGAEFCNAAVSEMPRTWGAAKSIYR